MLPLLVVGTLGAACPPSAQAQESPLGLEVTSAAGRPAMAGVVRLAVAATAAGPLAFDWSADGGRTWLPIAVDADPLDGWSADWDSRPFSGKTLVRAVAADGTAEIMRVTVDNDPPRVVIRLTRRVSNGAGAPAAGVVSASEPVTSTLLLSRPGGRPRRLKLRSPEANRSTFAWDGRSGGSLAADGTYQLRVLVADMAGNEAQASATILLDTTAPRVERLHVLADSGGRAVRVRAHVAERNALASVELRIRATNGGATQTVRRLRGSAGPISLDWRRGRPLRPGAYRIEIVATDMAGNATTATGPSQLVRYPVRTTLVSRVRTAHRQVALTFDDCYDRAAWERILDILAGARLRAAFFCPGQAVLAAPHAARRTFAEGHVIGSHGWDHADFSFLPFESALQRLLHDSAVWWGTHRAAATPYFRPPYGAYSPATLAAAGAAGYTETVLWDVDPRDWTRPGTAVLTQRVLADARPGSIILLHTLTETAAALPTLLEALRRRGLLPVGIDELIAASEYRVSAPGWPWARAGAR
ncbi:MAG: polysaccharide deacetylase family protein [Actinobacteria bacterium]|nr:polysaccharide deacetylase family protein [Actinomycetota bacterium]